MTEDDLINLQKLTGRSPQSWSLPPEDPDHILAAKAMLQLWPELADLPGPTDEQLMMADALRRCGQGTSPDAPPAVADRASRELGGSTDLAMSNLGIQAVADRSDKKKECIERCSDLALPTGDYGTAFHRCVATCLGEADWPEWKKYFPNNRDGSVQPAQPAPQQQPQPQHAPWWLPLLPFLIRVAPAAAAAAAA